MRIARILFAVLALALAVYAYFYFTSGPETLTPDVDKLMNDPNAAVAALKKSVESKSEPDTAPAAHTGSTNSAHAPVIATVHIPATSSPGTPPVPATPSAPIPPEVYWETTRSWSPPDVLPAQPNWTWTTSDGTTYQNVVVTEVKPETVSITHALGVAHDIPIASLPSDIQKKLNYDVAAAAAARAESARESAHPYYPFAARAEAQSVARQMHWPLAWMDSIPADLSVANPVANSEEDLTQRALNSLKTQAIVILADGNNDLANLPPLVLSQIFILDDGPMPGGHHFYAPKIVLTNTAATKILGRISSTQLKGQGVAAIDEAFASIPREQGSASATNPSAASTLTPLPSASAPAVVSALVASPTSPAPAAPKPPATPAQPVVPPPVAVKPWSPPAVLPAQPNWTWTTLDGTTYQNVVITDLEPDTVSIRHAMGVAHGIPMANLPPDIQKQLHYDPAAVAAARIESERESAHPYYTMSERAEAQTVAQQAHWPLAWVSSFQAYIAIPHPPNNEDADLTVLALNYLKDKSVIIFLDPDRDMGQTPPDVHHQFSQKDDGALAGAANYRAPKIVFTSPDASTVLGRVAYAQMKAGGEAAIGKVIDTFPKDPSAPPAPSGPTTEEEVTPINASAPAAKPASSTVPAPPATAPKPAPVITPSPVPASPAPHP